MCGGDNGIRTRGLCLAKAALSQLSHIPINLWPADTKNIIGGGLSTVKLAKQG